MWLGMRVNCFFYADFSRNSDTIGIAVKKAGLKELNAVLDFLAGNEKAFSLLVNKIRENSGI